jgi:flagellar L-ring protein FlgH
VRSGPKRALAYGTVLAGVFSAACVRHIRPYTPKVRDYHPDTYAAAEAHPSEGSLWSEGTPGLFEDTRARRLGDVVTVVISESSDASDEAATSASEQSSHAFGVSSFFSAMKRLQQDNPNLDPAKLIEAMRQSDFSGSGGTSRKGKLRATLTARVKRVLPNGDLYVEGHKVLMINSEESHFYMSGVARPVDINTENAVASSVLADVQIEYTGRGMISDSQEPGWFSRFLDALWPF